MAPDRPADDGHAEDTEAYGPIMEIDGQVVVELGEMLEFIHDWLGGPYAAESDASLRRFVGTDGFADDLGDSLQGNG